MISQLSSSLTLTCLSWCFFISVTLMTASSLLMLNTHHIMLSDCGTLVTTLADFCVCPIPCTLFLL